MKKHPEGIPFQVFLQICSSAKDKFSFLDRLGFSITTERLPQTNSFKDGFYLKFKKDPVSVTVHYFDMEYDILFTKGTLTVSYLFIDKYLFNNQSGFKSNMFTRGILPKIMTQTAADIEKNYGSILNGEGLIWQKLEDLFTSINRPTTQ